MENLCRYNTTSANQDCSSTSLVTAGLTVLPTNVCTFAILKLLDAMVSLDTKQIVLLQVELVLVYQL